MRVLPVAILLLLTAFIAPAALGAEWIDEDHGLLQKYVTKNGVRYKAWHGDKGDRAKLRRVVEAIGGESLKGKTKNERLAFYLNAYNAWILQRILAEYPTDGPGGGGLWGRNKFFKAKSNRVAGSTTSFSDLENKIIRPKFRDPRIHFAVNCASYSCPPLHKRAFRAETLDQTLDALTTEFVSSNRNAVVRVSGGSKLKISKIFDWYEDDFKSAGGPVAFMNKYRSDQLPSNAGVAYQDYRWSLNESK